MRRIKLEESIVSKMPQTAIVSKRYIVWHGIWKSLNDTPERRTYFDTSLRLAIYDHVGVNSVNIDGNLFNKIWAWMMQPKYVITQNSPALAQNGIEESPGIIRSFFNKITGRGQQPGQGGQQNG